MTEHSVSHPFHLVAPSPWPLAAAAAALVLVVGLLNLMHDGRTWALAPGALALAVVLVAWWRDVVREGRRDHAHTAPVRRGLRLGMALFITSEVMFFVGFFWAYFHNALHVSPVIANQWPPPGVEAIDAFGLPLFNTVLLVGSGVVLMGGRGGLMAGDRRRMLAGLLLAPLMGLAFVVLQAVEYGHAAFAFRSGVYASTFYMATGFHGFHVLVGAVMLLVMFLRARRGQFSPEHHVGLEAAEWYWHFVDVVWLFLYTFFYVWVGLS